MCVFLGIFGSLLFFHIIFPKERPDIRYFNFTYESNEYDQMNAKKIESIHSFVLN